MKAGRQHNFVLMWDKLKMKVKLATAAIFS